MPTTETLTTPNDDRAGDPAEESGADAPAGVEGPAHRSGRAGRDTRGRLLDAAERLFGELGYSNVSTRQIAEAAKANVAAAHYHFGSKEGLLRAVFERRLAAINAEREGLLADCVRAAGGRPEVGAVLDAFIRPVLRLSETEGGRRFNLLAGRSSTDSNPDVRRVVFEVYDAVGRGFVDAAAAACPQLSREELFWRLACVYGAMMYIRADNGRLQRLFGPEFSLSDVGGALRFALPFLTAGMRAPPAADDPPRP
ncbi:TetR/AcrR family transcriptional regulator [Rhodoplanes serenus]|uniref:TetR/AcrR family transcriptional regulator n=1 Tax=Rhodoplanes serenus TaxID=200615 RepID=UPI000DAC40F0|nr:TetR/AcrR family transcriptional regulator [Rhodoplanes serenus]RAI32007.1 hypothetical protein CH340_16845 [Rhodoplanes serenus]